MYVIFLHAYTHTIDLLVVMATGGLDEPLLEKLEDVEAETTTLSFNTGKHCQR